MADTKPSAFPALTGANMAGGDLVPIIDVSATLDKVATLDELVLYLQARGLPRVKRLGTQHSNSTATGTEVTDLTMALEAGTYVFDYYLMCRVATAANGILLGVNFDGTAASKTMIINWADAATALTAEVHAMDDQGNLGFGTLGGMANKAYTTTSPNMGSSVGFSTTASDTPVFIRGLLIVTVAGNLELWHSTETTTASTIEVGSSLVVHRTA